MAAAGHRRFCETLFGRHAHPVLRRYELPRIDNQPMGAAPLLDGNRDSVDCIFDVSTHQWFGDADVETRAAQYPERRHQGRDGWATARMARMTPTVCAGAAPAPVLATPRIVLTSNAFASTVRALTCRTDPQA